MKHLKRKHKYDKQKDDAGKMIDNIEAQIDALQMLSTTKQMTEAMQVAGAAFKAGKQDVDKLDDTMADIEEHMADIREVNDTLTRQLAPGVDVDDDELLAELEDLEQEDLEAQLADLNPSRAQPEAAEELDLPDVPTAVPKSKAAAKKAADPEMDDLLAWAN